MKPIKLRITAFGSYPGTEVVDFEALARRGLFVVSGDTGTGKSTIFDAMCWALYGDMPGKDSKEVRSHHVADEVRTEVEFTFDCDGERYVVTRNPEQLRPRKGGTAMVREAASASLVRITDGGTESRATRSSDVSTQCAELVGLDREQFQRVILLPQGEFAKFLLAGTDAREPLLSKLFGGQVYDRMVEQLKIEKEQLSAQLGTTDVAIVEQLNSARTNVARAVEALGREPLPDLADADRARLGEAVTALDAPIEELRAEVAQLETAAGRAAAAHTTATEEAERFDQAIRHRSALARLDAGQEQIDAGSAAAERSAAARPVVLAGGALETARKTSEDSTAQLRNRVADIAERFAVMGVQADTSSATALTTLLGEERRRVEADAAKLGRLVAARASLERARSDQAAVSEAIATTTTAREVDEAERARLEQRIPELQAEAVDVEAIGVQIAQVEERIRARAGLDDALERQAEAMAAADRAAKDHDDAFRAFVRTEAPRLAETLEAGAPCPVCGSREHPAPATSDGGPTMTHARVQAAGEVRQRAAQALTSVEQDVARLRGLLGDDAGVPLGELDGRRVRLVERRQAAEAAHSEIGGLTAELGRRVQAVARAGEELAKLGERADSLARAVTEANGDLTAAEQDATGLDPDAVERRRSVLESLAPLCGGVELLFTAATSAADAEAAAGSSLAAAVAASPFDTLEAARAELLPLEREEAQRAARQKAETDRAAAVAALEVLERLGVPDERPDVEVAREAAAGAGAAHRSRSDVLRTVTDARTYAADALGGHDELVEGSGDLRHRAEVAERAHRVCNAGGPGAPMSLKRWILTQELDRVTGAANRHLHRMTGSRYTLRRREERTDGRRAYGLDLEVLDAQTGRARSTPSLSGGEQFQASLALALGLADVVSHGGVTSGKRFEALFVDEGFGSLSAEALDDAVETLYHLQDSGRMVGAITHVDAMKQQIHVGIEVRRRPDGAGSTLVVHP